MNRWVQFGPSQKRRPREKVGYENRRNRRAENCIFNLAYILLWRLKLCVRTSHGQRILTPLPSHVQQASNILKRPSNSKRSKLLAIHASESGSQASEHPRSYATAPRKMMKFSFEGVSLVAALDLSLVPRPSSNISLHCLSGNFILSRLLFLSVTLFVCSFLFTHFIQ